MVYGTMDVGQDYRKSRLTGARCNRDDVGGLFCGPPGSTIVPFGTKVINNTASWSSLRLGAELKAKLWDRLTLRTYAAILPVAYLWNDDSHFLRTDLGPVPNIEDSSTGWGYQLEGEVRLDVTDHWALGAGGRYWYAETNFINICVATELQDFTSERFGVLGNATYRFNTY